MTSMTDPTSRRRVIVASLSGLAGMALAAMGRPGTVAAHDPDDVEKEAPNIVGGTTTFENISTNADVLLVQSASAGMGVIGQSINNTGVWGDSQTLTGVLGTSASKAGVVGVTGGSILSSPALTGVFGFGDSDTSVKGVFGKSTIGTGVRGEATSGVGLQAVATTGKALAVSGRATFTRSGRASVAAGASSVDVAVVGGLASAANVLATLQTHIAGVHVEGVRINVPSSGMARIYLNKVASATTATPVAWFVIG